MPELPEAEVVRRGLEDRAAGSEVLAVAVHDQRSLRRHDGGPGDFCRRLTGRRLLCPARRGKYLWIPLDHSAEALVIHLGMSGQTLMSARRAPAEKHLKVSLDLERVDAKPEQLRFVDQRIFGGMQISALVPSSHPSGTIPAVAAHIGWDPLEPAAEAEVLFRALRRRRSGLKRALLDQTLVSGIGNIYADEALWHARLHYARRTETLTRAETAGLLDSVRDVMTEALAAGGTSFDALYVDVEGASGYFDRSLSCYGRAGLACTRCAGTPRASLIRREPFMGRSSYRCPTCQPRPRNGRW